MRATMHARLRACIPPRMRACGDNTSHRVLEQEVFYAIEGIIYTIEAEANALLSMHAYCYTCVAPCMRSTAHVYYRACVAPYMLACVHAL